MLTAALIVAALIPAGTLLMAVARDDTVGESEDSKPLNAGFPDIRMAIYERPPAGTVVDGELVCWVDGRGILPAASAAVAARFYSQVRHRGGGARP